MRSQNRRSVGRRFHALAHRGAIVASVTGAALFLTVCGEARPDEFRIGLLGVVTDPMGSVSGIPAREGAQLAVDEINAAGGVEIAGRMHHIVLVDRAVEPRPDASASGARELINLDSVHAIVGPQISAQALAAAGVAEPSGVPLISPMASNPAVTQGRPLIFRLAFLDQYQGDLLARFALDSMRVRRAAVLHDAANPYGVEITRLFAETFRARGGELVAIETFTTDAASDFRPQLRRLLASRPDAILLPNWAVFDSVQMKQARALGFRGTFLGTDSWDPVALGNLTAARGSLIVANWDQRATREPAQRFVRAYGARYGGVPRTTAAATYDAIHLLARSASIAGSLDGDAIATALRNLGPYEGASASFEFVGTGDPRRGGVVLQFLGGRDSLRFVDVPVK